MIPVAHAAAESVRAMTQDWPFQVVFAEMEERFDAFAASDAAMAKSGTVTLELALAGVPMVVAYRVSADHRLPRPPHGRERRSRLAGEPARRPRGGAGVHPGGVHRAEAR